MLGKSFTLTIRSLRVDSRLLRAHLMRFLLLSIMLWLLFVAHEQSIRLGAPGLDLFTSIAWLNFMFLSLAGISYFATAITEEKEEMTLGLLRMAGISPLSLLLGKSTPRLVTAALLLVAQLPFTLLAITLGGVTTHQVTATYVALLAYTLLLAGLGLFCSVALRTSRAASWMTFVALFALLAVPWILSTILSAYVASGYLNPTSRLAAWPAAVLQAVSDASIIRSLFGIMQTGFAQPVVSYQVTTNVAAGAALFGLSWLCFGVFVREDHVPTPGRALFSRRTARLRTFAAGRAWTNALVWKDFHFLAGGKTMIVVKLLAYGVTPPAFLLFQWVVWGLGSDFDELGMTMMITMLLAGGVELPLYASRLFWEEIKWKTLPAIAIIPGSVMRMAYTKVAGCLLALGPAVFYFALGVLLDPDDFIDGLEDALGEPAFWWIVTQYVLFLHLVVLVSLFVKWGALPVAFAIVFAANGCCITFAETIRSDEESLFVFLILAGAVAIVVVQAAIGQRVRRLAAQ